MTQNFFKLFVLISCSAPILASDFSDITDISDEVNISRKPFNSLQVAGSAIVTGLTSLNALNVKQGADFGGDVAVDGNMFVDGGIVLDSCLVLTCTSAGQLLVNGIAVSSSTNVNLCDPIPLTILSTGTTITNPGYYCLAQPVTDLAAPITISGNDITLDLNNQTITLAVNYIDAIDVSGNRITIKNGIIVMPSENNNNGIALNSGGDFHIYDININGASFGIQTIATGLTNLDIARVTVANSASNAYGFYINQVVNGTISECNANNISDNAGFFIWGADGSSVLVNSCVATDNVSAVGFQIYGPNVTITNCVAQNNANGFLSQTTSTNLMLANCTANFNTGSGFYINGSSTTFLNCLAQGNGYAGFYITGFSSGGLMLTNCTANDNTGSGFLNVATNGGQFNFISCVAQNNTGSGFDVSGSYNPTSPANGLIKSCFAENNGTPTSSGYGFNDVGPVGSSPSLYQYVANAAQGNYGSDYALGGSFAPLGSTPFYQYIPNPPHPGNGFVPTYWNNVTLVSPPV